MDEKKKDVPTLTRLGESGCIMAQGILFNSFYGNGKVYPSLPG
jgi:hypothetical protein